MKGDHEPKKATASWTQDRTYTTMGCMMVTLPTSHHKRDQDRARIKQQCRSLNEQQKHGAALALAKQLTQHPKIQEATHIGIYWPLSHELKTQIALDILIQQGKCLYLPHIDSTNPPTMSWSLYDDATATMLTKNMPQPTCNDIKQPELDVIILPIIGVDARGYRLGSGMGFYDRHLDQYQQDAYLIAVGYDIQALDSFKEEPWDKPADETLLFNTSSIDR